MMTSRQHCLVHAALTAVAVTCLSICSASAAAQGASPLPPLAAPTVAGGADSRPRRADFGPEASSPAARELADWVMASSDNHNLPFIVIDKVQARVFAFDAQGSLRGASAALLGTAVGDDSVPGIGQRKLSTIRPFERTTPAGRFVAYLDRDIHGEEVLWVDYDSALSLHRIITTQPKERRAQRLASPTPADNRITYGCINVAVAFYEGVVSPLFQRTQGIVYILPERRAASDVFGSHAVPEQLPLPAVVPALAVNAVPVR
jgi:hypothetical protein